MRVGADIPPSARRIKITKGVCGNRTIAVRERWLRRRTLPKHAASRRRTVSLRLATEEFENWCRATNPPEPMAPLYHWSISDSSGRFLFLPGAGVSAAVDRLGGEREDL
ncbi:MAG TPA: hypothetical protein VMP68_32990 [Candidatus Eisenbacteria bacterium]|nr:hypothetical protein [Candidatus Eisenbacteria bacterium]